MFKTANISWRAVFTTGFLAALLCLVTISFAGDPPVKDATCNPPANVTKTSHTSSSVSFTWTPGGTGEEFKIWYYRAHDAFTSTPAYTEDNGIVFNNLTSGTYDFYFARVCGEETSTSIIIDDLLME